MLLFLLWGQTCVLLWPVVQKQLLLHVDCWHACPVHVAEKWKSAKRSLFNVPLFTNTAELTKGCSPPAERCFLHDAKLISHRLDRVLLVSSAASVCGKGKIHIAGFYSSSFFFCFNLHKALDETWLPKRKHVKPSRRRDTTYSLSVFWSSVVWESVFVEREQETYCW